MISVIVPTYNRSTLLGIFLESIIWQTLESSSYEILVIDNASTDDTRDTVIQYATQIRNLYYFYEPHPGLHAGRHRGFLEAKGEILIYADDDIKVFPTWLEVIQSCFQNPKVVMVGGKNLPMFESPPPLWIQSMWHSNQSGDKILGYLSILDLGEQPKNISPMLVFGCNFSIRRQALLEANGFHPDGMPEHLVKYRGDGESHVSNYVASQRYKAFYHPEASVYHWVPNKRMTVEYFCHRAYKQGISDSYTQFRKAGRLSYQVSVSIATTQFLSLSHKMLPRALSWMKRKIMPQVKAKFLQKKTSDVSTSTSKTEIEKIQAQIRVAYKAGYDFHQQAVNGDPVLLKWVMRPDYWDYRLPTTESYR